MLDIRFNNMNRLLIFGLSIFLLSCCKKEERDDLPLSTGSIIQELHPKWKEGAEKGDLDAAYALVVWKSENDAHREEKLIELATLGHERSMITLYTAYSTGALLGIKKNCSLAWKWHAELRKKTLHKGHLTEVIKECPQ